MGYHQGGEIDLSKDDRGVLLDTVKNDATSVVTDFFTVLHQFLNGNTSIETWDKVTSAFVQMSTSGGFLGLDTFLNVFGNIFTVVDVVDALMERREQRVRDARDDAEKAIKEADTSEDDFRKELQESLSQVVSQLTVINEQLASRLIPSPNLLQPSQQQDRDPDADAVTLGEQQDPREMLKEDEMDQFSQIVYDHRYFLSPSAGVYRPTK